MHKTISLLFILFAVSLRAQSPATFSFNINGPAPVGFEAYLKKGAERWSNHLLITVPVKVNVFIINTPLIPFSGLTLANGVKNFPNAPEQNISYVTALANQIAGTELNPGQYDMDIYFNLNSSFYYGDGNPPFNQIDFITLAMHEIGHGLGFYSTAYVDANGLGSFGNIPSSAISPISTSFPWPGQLNVPTIYDKHILLSSGNRLTDCAPANSANLGDSIKTGPHYFSGSLFANASNNNQSILLSGGDGSFYLGESILHLDENFSNTIMSYYWGAGDTVRTPAPRELGMLREIGWNLKLFSGLADSSPADSRLSFYPNPVSSVLTVQTADISSLKLTDSSGRNVLEKNNSLHSGNETLLDLSDYANGVYFLTVTDKKQNSFSAKVVILH